jgi:siderophore synthetase component
VSKDVSERKKVAEIHDQVDREVAHKLINEFISEREEKRLTREAKTEVDEQGKWHLTLCVNEPAKKLDILFDLLFDIASLVFDDTNIDVFSEHCSCDSVDTEN